MTAPSETPTTKGAILRSLLHFIDNDLTPEQRVRAFQLLSEEERAQSQRSAVLSSQKVPESLLNHLTVAAAAAKGEDLDSFGRRAGDAELREAVGVYRFLTMVLTPTALLRKASTLWSTVHSHGALSVEEGDRTARLRLTDFPSEAAHCARLTGWFEGAGKLTHAKNARVVHDVCMTRGDKQCEWQLTWG